MGPINSAPKKKNEGIATLHRGGDIRNGSQKKKKEKEMGLNR